LQACKTKTVLNTDKPFGGSSAYISESMWVQPFRKILKNERVMRFKTRRFVCRELFDKTAVAKAKGRTSRTLSGGRGGYAFFSKNMFVFHFYPTKKFVYEVG